MLKESRVKPNFNIKLAVVTRIVGITVLACAGCCLLSGGALFGVVVAAGLVMYWPWIGLLLLLLSIALVVWRKLKAKQKPVCHLDGSCAPKL